MAWTTRPALVAFAAIAIVCCATSIGVVEPLLAPRLGALPDWLKSTVAIVVTFALLDFAFLGVGALAFWRIRCLRKDGNRPRK